MRRTPALTQFRRSGLTGYCAWLNWPVRRSHAGLSSIDISVIQNVEESDLTDLLIVIVSYNTRDLLRECLASLDRGCEGLSVSVAVVDNASLDGSADMVASEFPQVRLVRNQQNIGFAAANNLVLRMAQSRYVVLLNPDTVVQPQALTKLVGFMDDTPAAGYCGPRLLNADGTHQRSANRFHTLLSDTLPLLGWARDPRSRHTVDLHILHGETNTFRADWLVGACLLIRAEAMRAVGILDETYFLYFEEVDWCRRMARAGWEGWYVGSSQVMHLGCQSVSYATDARPFWGHDPHHHVRSFRRYMRKYHGWVGMALACLLQAVAYAFVWIRNSWAFLGGSPQKARNAALALRHLLR